MRDLLADTLAARKRPVWNPEMFWEKMMKNKNEGRRVSRAEKHTSGSISFTKQISKKVITVLFFLQQADLSERFSKSKYLEELHKNKKWDKTGQYLRQKVEEEAATTGTAMPDELHLMAIVASGLSRAGLYRVVLEATHLRAESSQVTAGLIMRRVEATVSSASAAFDEHMRRFAE
ncbi:hypothetical protein M9H77_08076 [Catharanthus roseus]|uniref:Uncharacterized protein n=1 Tax=Catharanthus roseus TaxID=4058 RepID=A0ACC0BX37_CATRO|nr:hypothetical protein M9H77_08076 [Catharanthus roseus]